MERRTKVGIGFATGRKSFQKVLRTYVGSWQECGLAGRDGVDLNLLVAYDLKYANTKSTDYTGISHEILSAISETYFIGEKAIQDETAFLTQNNIITQKEAGLFFGGGYAAKRNSVLYTAMKNSFDYLIFLDDDEYPLAVTKTHSTAVWGGQHVLSSHLDHIRHADITNGHHCGYISPIPYIRFNDTLTEGDFRVFIEAISNDIINWDTIRSVMESGGVTYADTRILTTDKAVEVPEINRAKFISGANLCINLTDPKRAFPFYNPPGARGEDTFLSTCLGSRKVLRVPCYTFHDGFSTCNHLLDGVLPISLKHIHADDARNITRFYRACIGWVRYKPLLLYITDRKGFEGKIESMRRQFARTLPKVCAYFGRDEFINVQKELERYYRNVETHYAQFFEIQRIWKKLTDFWLQRAA